MKEEKLQALEKEVIKELHNTGLFTKIKIHPGNLKDPKDPPYIEYKIKHRENGKIPEKIGEKIDELRIHVIRKIYNPNSAEINNIISSLDWAKRLYKEELIINPQANIIDEIGFRANILSTIKKEVKNYLMQIA